jgi:hypothetical protein
MRIKGSFLFQTPTQTSPLMPLQMMCRSPTLEFQAPLAERKQRGYAGIVSAVARTIGQHRIAIATNHDWCGPQDVSPCTLPIDDQRNLDAFRMGAAIYTGTFLLGHNWDYRLIFLVLRIPQTAWAHTTEVNHRSLAFCTLALSYLTCWFLLFRIVSVKPGHLYELLFLIDQTANWALFASVVCLLGMSAPAWLRTPFDRFSRTAAPTVHGPQLRETS